MSPSPSSYTNNHFSRNLNTNSLEKSYPQPKQNTIHNKNSNPLNQFQESPYAATNKKTMASSLITHTNTSNLNYQSQNMSEIISGEFGDQAISQELLGGGVVLPAAVRNHNDKALGGIKINNRGSFTEMKDYLKGVESMYNSME